MYRADSLRHSLEVKGGGAGVHRSLPLWSVTLLGLLLATVRGVCAFDSIDASRPSRLPTVASPEQETERVGGEDIRLHTRTIAIGSPATPHSGPLDEAEKGAHALVAQAVGDATLCSSGPCHNGGVCNSNATAYWCDCSAVDYSGVGCETKIDDCAPTPCQNGGTCTDGVRTFSCACGTTATGSSCGTLLWRADAGQSCAFAAAGASFDFSGLTRAPTSPYVARGQSGFDFAFNVCQYSAPSGSSSAGRCGGSYAVPLPVYAYDGGSTCLPISGNPPPGSADMWTFTAVGSSPLSGVWLRYPAATTNPCSGGAYFNLGVRLLCGASSMAALSAVLEPSMCSYLTNLTSVHACPVSCVRGGRLCSDAGHCSAATSPPSCACNSGYSGAFCETPPSACLAMQCLNGGSCRVDASNNGYCDCATGFSGDRCQWSPCLSGPCQNGGLCTPVTASTFSCNCSGIDYAGDTCQTQIDDCASAVCANGGTCLDGVRTFTCRCPTGAGGPTCGSLVWRAGGQPCTFSAFGTSFNFTALMRASTDPYVAHGLSGYDFAYNVCQYSEPSGSSGASSCGGTSSFPLPVYAYNGGSCLPISGAPAAATDPMWSFTAAGTDGLGGVLLRYPQSTINPCGGGAMFQLGVRLRCGASATATLSVVTEPSLCSYLTDLMSVYACPQSCVAAGSGGGVLCSNHGRCSSATSPPSCVCDGGFGGATCETALSVCQAVECLHGGSCRVSANNNVYCDCVSGFSGDHCELGPCASDPCRNGGACSANSTAYTCDCSTVDFGGANCDTPLDDCALAAAAGGGCQNGGSCHDGVRTFTCDCPDSHSGATCGAVRWRPGLQPCTYSVGGTSFDFTPLIREPTKPYVTGKSDYWFAYNVCQYSLPSGASSASNCVKDPKAPLPIYAYAQGSAACVPISGAPATASAPMWSFSPVHGDPAAGIVLQYPQATTDVCPNGAYFRLAIELVCSDSTAAALSPIVEPFTCSYTTNITSLYACPLSCVHNSRLCGGAGRCSSATSPASCLCNSGFGGEFCETPLAVCASVHCANGGSCRADPNNSPFCDCALGFTGDRCESGPCTSNPCVNGGVCHANSTAFTCDCSATDYAGVTCQTPVDDCVPNPCRNGGSCTDGLRSYTCRCSELYTGPRCAAMLWRPDQQPCTFSALGASYDFSPLTRTPTNPYKSAKSDYVFAFNVCQFSRPSGSTSANNCVGSQEVAPLPVYAYATGGSACLPISGAPDPTAPAPAYWTFKSVGTDPTTGVVLRYPPSSVNQCSNGAWFNLAITLLCGTNSTAAVGALTEPSMCSYSTTLTSLYACPVSCINNGRLCGNAGHCSTATSPPSCACNSGYGGVYCENAFAVCESVQCQNGGSCRADANNVAYCECVGGYAGSRCEAGPCSSNPCVNGGVCRGNSTAFVCDCSAVDFTGVTCQTRIDDCAVATGVTTCQNGGTCVDGMRTFSCNCGSLHTGARCGSVLWRPGHQPCAFSALGASFNFSALMRSPTAPYIASKPGFDFAFNVCQYSLPSASSVAASCTAGASAPFPVYAYSTSTCYAIAGPPTNSTTPAWWTFSHTVPNDPMGGVTIKYPPATSNQCPNGAFFNIGINLLCGSTATATVSGIVESPMCTYSTNLTSLLACPDSCVSGGRLCSNAGRCSSATSPPSCWCNSGLGGAFCDTVLAQCKGVQCHNSGSCRVDSAGAAYCECTAQFAGPLCQYANPCASAPCGGHTSCSVVGANTTLSYVCVPIGSTGPVQPSSNPSSSPLSGGAIAGVAVAGVVVVGAICVLAYILCHGKARPKPRRSKRVGGSQSNLQSAGTPSHHSVELMDGSTRHASATPNASSYYSAPVAYAHTGQTPIGGSGPTPGPQIAASLPPLPPLPPSTSPQRAAI